MRLCKEWIPKSEIFSLVLIYQKPHEYFINKKFIPKNNPVLHKMLKSHKFHSIIIKTKVLEYFISLSTNLLCSDFANQNQTKTTASCAPALPDLLHICHILSYCRVLDYFFNDSSVLNIFPRSKIWLYILLLVYLQPSSLDLFAHSGRFPI